MILDNGCKGWRIGVALFTLLAGIGLTLLAHWEPGPETWGYWLFARIFAETGKFVISGRSPLYCLYLNLFWWMGYPFSVSVEYVVTSFIAAASLILLFRRYLPLVWLTLAVILWLPFLQDAEPPVQKLAMAFSCLAIVAREQPRRLRLALSYTLFGMASMFRSTYSLCIPAFLLYDGVQVFRKGGVQGFGRALRPQRYDWPILVVLVFSVWFGVMQSPHRWNNASRASAIWFPDNGKSLSNGAFLQNFNAEYILHKYGSFEGKDYYFTNQELFAGASTMVAAILANPRFFIQQSLRNVKRALIIGVKFTLLPHVFYEKVPKGSPLWYFIHPFITLPLAWGILYGVFRACQSKDMILFSILNILLIGSSILALPKERYMHSLIPLLILAASWYGQKIQSFVGRRKSSGQLFGLFLWVIIPLVFILFSNGIVGWGTIIKDISRDLSAGQIRVLERRPYSMKASKISLEGVTKNCHGVMAGEHAFLGAFMGIALDRLYDIWEIPPFGRYGDSVYEGLQPQRINCLLLDPGFPRDIGASTNQLLRYQNYIEPYVKQLKAMGATTYKIERYGEVVVLENAIGTFAGK